MGEIRVEFATESSVEECASTFQQAVHGAYGGSRKLMYGVKALSGAARGGGLEFFTPSDTPFDSIGQQPSWKAGAYVPGFNKLWGARQMAIHIYVIDRGADRVVQLVGPYNAGEKGTTQRLIESVASAFEV